MGDVAVGDNRADDIVFSEGKQFLLSGYIGYVQTVHLTPNIDRLCHIAVYYLHVYRKIGLENIGLDANTFVSQPKSLLFILRETKVEFKILDVKHITF